MNKEQAIIGRAEKIDVIGGAERVPAKIDTGAYRSSIHAGNFKIIKTDNGDKLQFDLLGHPLAPESQQVTVSDFSRIKVTSSNGVSENRYEVRLKIKLGTRIFKTSFSLADRSNNVFPILIGRRAIKRRFIVDVSKTNVDRKAILKSLGHASPRDEEDLED